MPQEAENTGKSSELKYKELRIKLMELSQKGQLLSGIRLDQCSVVSDGEKFVMSHIHYLDKFQSISDSGKKYNYHIVKPYFHRLLKYYKIISNNE